VGEKEGGGINDKTALSSLAKKRKKKFALSSPHPGKRKGRKRE